VEYLEGAESKNFLADIFATSSISLSHEEINMFKLVTRKNGSQNGGNSFYEFRGGPSCNLVVFSFSWEAGALVCPFS